MSTIKAALFNLITVAAKLEEKKRSDTMIQLITNKFPANVFAVQTDETAKNDFFEIDHSTETVGHGNNLVSFDKITLTSSKNELKRAPFAIMPKLLPDLPLYIFVSHDPTKDQVILPELQQYATRVIFDNQNSESIQTFAEKILASIDSTHGDFVDLNWAKTKAWREVLARVFNDKEKIADLTKSKSIQITYTDAMQTQSVYLQAWLAAELGWTFVSCKKTSACLQILYKSKDTPIEVTLLAQNSNKDSKILGNGEVFSIDVQTHANSQYTITHENQPNQVVVHTTSTVACQMPYGLFLNNYQTGSALINEILYQPPSEHYIHMLQILTKTTL